MDTKEIKSMTPWQATKALCYTATTSVGAVLAGVNASAKLTEGFFEKALQSQARNWQREVNATVITRRAELLQETEEAIDYLTNHKELDDKLKNYLD